MSTGLGYEPGPMGWVVPGTYDEQKMLAAERRYFEMAFNDYPIAYCFRQAKSFLPKVKEKWDKFQLDRGRFAGSSDLTLIDEFIFGKSLTWLPQDIGSCVWSNTFREIFARQCVEIALRGDAEEYFGQEEFGQKSLAAFCVSYGFARQRANMKGSDGLYCKPMSESLVKDGLVLCNTPKLKELLDAAGATDPTNYPEPRSAGLYRRIGDWHWNEALRPYAASRLLECPDIVTMDDYILAANSLKPAFQCSMIAIRKIGTHPDGFDIHSRDPNRQWAHNMGRMGIRVASDGKQYVRIDNTSWLQSNNSNKEAYIYNVPIEEVAEWHRNKRCDVSAIGEIDGVPSIIPA